MKYILKYAIILPLIFGAMSCDEDDDVPYVAGNSLVSLENSEISFFDTDATLVFNVSELSASSALTGLEVFVGENKVGDGVIVDETTATITSGVFLPFEFEEEEAITNVGTIDLLALSTEENGEVGRNELSINIVKPLSFSNEISNVTYGDVELDDDAAIITFEVFTLDATVDNITLNWKNGEDGTYVEDESFEIDGTTGTIDLRELDYINEYGLEAGDELFYEVVATSGDLSDSIETSLTFEPQLFLAPIILDFDTDTTDQFMLSTGEIVNDSMEGSTAEIEFTSDQGFTTLNDIMFVKLDDSGEEFFTAYTEVAVAKADYEAGIPTNTTQVVAGDIYVYEVTRDDVVYYGTILVSDVINTNDGANISFNLSVKENFEINIDTDEPM